MCLMALAPATKPRATPGPSHAPLGSSSRLLALGSSGAVTCPMAGYTGCELLN
jgi:hypothetical protein